MAHGDTPSDSAAGAAQGVTVSHDSDVMLVPGASACLPRTPNACPKPTLTLCTGLPRASWRSSGGDTGAKRWCSRCAHSRASRLHARRPSTKRPPASADARSRASSASYALPARLYACRDARRGRGRPRHRGPRPGARRLARPAGASACARPLARGWRGRTCSDTCRMNCVQCYAMRPPGTKWLPWPMHTSQAGCQRRAGAGARLRRRERPQALQACAAARPGQQQAQRQRQARAVRGARVRCIAVPLCPQRRRRGRLQRIAHQRAAGARGRVMRGRWVAAD
jgi:hypothetical protein